MERLIENLLTFSSTLQNGNSLEQIYKNAIDRQNKLVLLSIDAVFVLSFYLSSLQERKKLLSVDIGGDIEKIFTIDEVYELLNKGFILSSRIILEKGKTVNEALVHCNALCASFFTVVDGGVKSFERAQLKVDTRYSGNPIFIADITRVAIAPTDPEHTPLLSRYFLSRGHMVSTKNTWDIRQSGIMSCPCYIDVDGYVAEIHINNLSQFITNNTLSHRVYEVIRFMTSVNHTFTLNISQEMSREIMENYNKIMEEYSIIDRNFITFSLKHDVKMFVGKELSGRFSELMLLHQSIHVQDICRASTKWQKLYCKLLIDLNRKSKETVFPIGLLRRIPQYENCVLEFNSGLESAK